MTRGIKLTGILSMALISAACSESDALGLDEPEAATLLSVSPQGGAINFSGPQNFHPLLQGPDETILLEDLGGHLPGPDAAQVPDVHPLVLHPVETLEPSLGNPALEGHLASLESNADTATGSRSLPVLTATGSFAFTGTRTPAHSLSLAVGS